MFARRSVCHKVWRVKGAGSGPIHIAGNQALVTPGNRYATNEDPKRPMDRTSSTEPRPAAALPPPLMAHLQVPEALQRGRGFGGDGH
jgi:hypothetical protein